VSEEVNRKCNLWNTTVQLATPYTDPERHLVQRYIPTDRQTDDIIIPIADPIVSSTIG